MPKQHKRVLEIPIPKMIAHAKTNRVCLPSFQRDFVWTPDQMAKLLESVVRHYPIGTLMWLATKGNEDLGKLSFVGTQANAFSSDHYVIDGQQRLKTFLELLSSGSHFRAKRPIEHKGRNFKIFYRIETVLSKIHDLEVDKPTFIVSKRTEPHESEDYEQQGRARLIPVEFILNEAHCRAWIERALPSHKTGSKRRILKNLREVRKIILGYSCPVEIIRMRLAAANHANMFRLLNEGGTDLTTFDLLVARLSPYDIDLRALWKSSLAEYRNISDFKIDPIYILKTVLLIRQNESPRPNCTMPQVKRIHQYYWEESNPRKAFALDWGQACQSMDRVIHDLKMDFGVPDPKYLPYSPMLVPMAAVKWYTKDYDQRFKGRMKDRLWYWYWGAIFNKSYEKSTDTRTGQHYVALREWLSPRARTNIPREINFRLSKAEVEEVIDRVRSTADAVYKAILCMPLVQGATDIYSYDYLGHGARLHDHHIFPKAYLRAQAEESGYEEEIFDMNHPINRMLITDKTNMEIQDKAPYKYLTRVKRRELARHFIPESAKSESADFDDFYSRRRRLLVDYTYRNLIGR